MEKILKFKGKFNINPRVSSINSTFNNYYSEQSANEEETENTQKSGKFSKHKASKFMEEEEEEKHPIVEKHHSNTLVIPKANLKTYETDNSEPNTPNDNNSKNRANFKQSKFKSLTVNENSQQEFNEISNQLFEVKIFSNFEAKNDHFTWENNRNGSTAMEIEPDPEPKQEITFETNKIETENEPKLEKTHENVITENHVEAQQINEQDVFKQQEEKLFKRNELKITTTGLKNKFQEEYMEINSEAKISKKKSKEDVTIGHPFRQLIFSPQCSDSIFKRHLTIIYRGLIYAKKCLKGPSDNYLKSKQIDLVSRIANHIPKNKTLILDLDETLIHSCGLKENPMHILKTTGEYGEETPIGLNVRPFCLEFIQELSNIYDIFVFTASSFAYATAVLKFLDPYTQFISGLLSRSNCMQTKNGFFIKDLRIIKNRDLKDIIIVDNLAHSFGFQINNGVPILEWHSGADSELYFLKNYLVAAATLDDVRQFNIENLRLGDLASKEPEELGI